MRRIDARDWRASRQASGLSQRSVSLLAPRQTSRTQHPAALRRADLTIGRCLHAREQLLGLIERQGAHPLGLARGVALSPLETHEAQRTREAVRRRTELGKNLIAARIDEQQRSIRAR